MHLCGNRIILLTAFWAKNQGTAVQAKGHPRWALTEPLHTPRHAQGRRAAPWDGTWAPHAQPSSAQRGAGVLNRKGEKSRKGAPLFLRGSELTSASHRAVAQIPTAGQPKPPVLSPPKPKEGTTHPGRRVGGHECTDWWEKHVASLEQKTI